MNTECYESICLKRLAIPKAVARRIDITMAQRTIVDKNLHGFSVKTNSSCSTCDTLHDTFVKPSMIDEINERQNCDYDKRIVPLS